MCALQLRGYNLTGTLPGSALVSLGLSGLVLSDNPGTVAPAFYCTSRATPVVGVQCTHLIAAVRRLPPTCLTVEPHPVNAPWIGLNGYLPVELLQQPNISLVRPASTGTSVSGLFW